MASPGAKQKGVGVVERTLQKSMDLIPLLPRAGPTGGLGLACPAPTMSLTTWSRAAAPRAPDILTVLLSCRCRV